MRIVTKHSGACVAVATYPEHKFVYTAGADGSIHVLSDGGEVVFSKPRQKAGAADLTMALGAGRLVYLENEFKTIGWRDVKIDPPSFPAGGQRTLPAGYHGLHLTTVASDHLAAVACSRGLIWLIQWGRGHRRTARIVREGRHELPDGQVLTCLQYVDPSGLFLAAGVHRGTTGASWNGMLRVYHGVLEHTFTDRLESSLEVDAGYAPVCIARTEGRVVYAGLEGGRVMRLDLREWVPGGPAPAPDVVRIPQTPKVTAVAVSACGRFVAVGADYEEYGGVLLYDADLKPLAMFDTTSEPYSLAFHQPWMPDQAPTPTLFSGHAGGQVIKWYLDRQLTWMNLVDERPTNREPRIASSDAEEFTHQRAIDL